MDIVTTANLPSREIHAVLGLVQHTTVVSAAVHRDLFASFRNVFGGKVASYEKILEEATQSAVRAVTDKAHALSANAIVGFSLSVASLPAEKGGFFTVTAVGTAVRAEAQNMPTAAF